VLNSFLVHIGFILASLPLVPMALLLSSLVPSCILCGGTLPTLSSLRYIVDPLIIQLMHFSLEVIFDHAHLVFLPTLASSLHPKNIAHAKGTSSLSAKVHTVSKQLAHWLHLGLANPTVCCGTSLVLSVCHNSWHRYGPSQSHVTGISLRVSIWGSIIPGAVFVLCQSSIFDG